MSDGLSKLEKRLQRLEQLLYRIAEKTGCLEEEREAIGPADGFTRALAKDWSALALRISKLEIKAVHMESQIGHYMRRRIARDNMLLRSADSMTDGIETFEERLNNVELAAFPSAAETVSKAIGVIERVCDPKSEALDRRLPRSKPKG